MLLNTTFSTVPQVKILNFSHNQPHELYTSFKNELGNLLRFVKPA